MYNFTRKQYVGVFSKIYLRFWEKDTEDINKVKRIKFNKQIHDILNVRVNQKVNTMVVYEDGTTESLDSALESRAEGKKESSKDEIKALENPQLTNEIFSFVRKSGNERHFCYTTIDPESLKSHSNAVKTFKLDRYGQDVKLMGNTVIRGKSVNSDPSLITIWSDKRLFKATLSPSDNFPTIGVFHAIVESINANNKISVTPISEDCVAIYASKHGDDGSFVILYNIKYKIVQSKVPFKVYLSNFKLWSIHKNIFLAMGDQLSVIPHRISADKLSSMVGSQCDSDVHTMVEKEMINEDLHYAENLEFDDDQTPVVDMEMSRNGGNIRKHNKAVTIFSADEVNEQLNEMYHEELVVDLVRMDEQPEESVEAKLLSNVDETFPLLSENFEVLCRELEKFGCSEIEITNKVIPVLLKTNRTEDVGQLLKRYNHVSEQMLIRIIQYLLSCADEDEESMEVDALKNGDEEIEFDRSKLCKDKKFKNVNVLLSTKQSERRDVLSIVLCSSFDSQSILKYLRKEVTLLEMVALMDHLYKILNTSSLDDPYDMRGNLVEGNDFDLDTKLFEWFRLLLDSHYQQILLSHDSELHNKLALWLELVDNHIRILTEMSEMRQMLEKLAKSKPINLSKKCNQWYSIEQLRLY